MKPSIHTEGPLPDLSGSYQITITETSVLAVSATIRIEQEDDLIRVSLEYKNRNKADSPPKRLQGRITERNRHHVIVRFENGTWERYVFHEGRFSGHEFLF
ncbi:hypothetical protein HGB47_19130 [Leptospira yasudae]|uniref:hypothetical protein n=1 Tax=Leptospira yasudae TaxID=2202201 RepID=UPI001C4F1AFF|nr:hypothetical protein [Leptospira yasudae]MBW0435723.1 hypothetical protein [Leptospira yasudae]